MNKKNGNLTWKKVQHDSNRLANIIIRESPKQFDKIMAITRGGMFPALIISEVLNINNIDTICVQSYKDKNQEPVEIIKFPIVTKKESWLIIDDLIDTGETIQTIINHIDYRFLDYKSIKPEFSIGVLYGKPKGLSRQLIDYYVEDVKDNWIVFPWEERINE